MLPDFGISEMFVVAVVALIVVGPKDLPVLLRRVGQFVARLRSMASEFRASFDDMARQSELDELRREVEALRTGKPAYSSPEDAARHAEITDIYSNIEGGVATQAALNAPASGAYDDEVLGFAPSAQPPAAPPSAAPPNAAPPNAAPPSAAQVPPAAPEAAAPAAGPATQPKAGAAS